jgi:hypothetical protein
MAIIKNLPEVEWGYVVASNSLDIAFGDMVTLTSWFAVKSSTTWKIDWVAVETNVFDSDNQTVKKEKLNIVKASSELKLQITADATITQADVWFYFNINSDQTADVATKTATRSVVNTSDAGAAADPVITMQLRLEQVIDTTVGLFSVVL